MNMYIYQLIYRAGGSQLSITSVWQLLLSMLGSVISSNEGKVSNI